MVCQASPPQTALLPVDHEFKDSTEKYSSTEQEGWSEVGDYVKFSEQFFSSEVTDVQDVILNVPEPQEMELKQILLCYLSVLDKTPGRTTLVKHYINVPYSIKF